MCIRDRATANGIFPRLLGWADTQSEETLPPAIKLAHGMAELNECYLRLQGRGVQLEEGAQEAHQVRIAVHVGIVGVALVNNDHLARKPQMPQHNVLLGTVSYTPLDVYKRQA